jgi:hypothetical protein
MAVENYVPRNVSQNAIHAMQNGFRNPGKWETVWHDFVNKGVAHDESEVIEKLTDAANLDAKSIDKKLGNLEKARTSRLPSSAYD